MRRFAGALAIAIAALLPAPRAAALVIATDPDDPLPFFRLDRPTGKFDETALAGFELLVSSRTGEFRAADMYLIAGEVTDPDHALALDLGGVAEIGGVPLAFSIEHRLTGGRRLLFRVSPGAAEDRLLCWGVGCPGEARAAERLGGLAPIADWNGLQVQVRAQEVPGASAALRLLSLEGVEVGGAPLFDEVVTPESPGTLPGDAGRRGQWLLADDLDFLTREWTLRGVVTLSRPDDATSDLTKVRLAVDLVRDPTLPFAVPEPGSLLLAAFGLAALGRHRPRPPPDPAQRPPASSGSRPPGPGARSRPCA